MKSPELQALGKRIRMLRLQRGMTQEELGDRAQLHRTYIGGVERGERNVSYLNLLVIARALNARLAELFSEEAHESDE